MTDRPYTDDDLRAEAARQHTAAIRSITPSEIADHMDRGHVLSTKTEDEATRRTWAELLNPDGDDTNEFKAARQQIDDLISRAADLSGWAVDLGADELEPADECLSLKGDGAPIVRIHFAFAPAVPDDVRQHVISGVAQAIDAEL